MTQPEHHSTYTMLTGRVPSDLLLTICERHAHDLSLSAWCALVEMRGARLLRRGVGRLEVLGVLLVRWVGLSMEQVEALLGPTFPLHRDLIDGVFAWEDECPVCVGEGPRG